MGTTSEVRAMYEKFPYPSPVTGSGVIKDNANILSVLFPDENFEGKKILDAGCGTGQRANGVAKSFPKAQVFGVDMTSASLDAAEKIAAHNGIKNIVFEQCDLLSLKLDTTFDIIISTGVIHHLEDPNTGLQNLRNHLTDSGLAMIWLYHSLGEFQRFVDRELLSILRGSNPLDLDKAASMMDMLNFDIGSHRYGSSAGQIEEEVSSRSINADAFMHPIVEAYRLPKGLSMLLSSGFDWASVASLNLINRSVLVDINGVIDPLYADLAVGQENLFEDISLQKTYSKLAIIDKLRTIELMLRPTAFTMFAGKSTSYPYLPRWLQQGAFFTESLDLLNSHNTINASVIR